MKFRSVGHQFILCQSPPTRGAWVEIFADYEAHNYPASPPTRGAWVEIFSLWGQLCPIYVAPHTGGVG